MLEVASPDCHRLRSNDGGNLEFDVLFPDLNPQGNDYNNQAEND